MPPRTPFEYGNNCFYHKIHVAIKLNWNESKNKEIKLIIRVAIGIENRIRTGMMELR